MIRGTTKIQKLCWVIFILYLFGILYFTVFAESLGRAYGTEAEMPRYNLTPFKEIGRFITYRKVLGMRAMLLNVAGNCIAFIPGGFLLPAVSRRCRRLLKCTFVGFVISFFIECTQIVFRVGSFDVDDLLLNTLGVALGFMINRAVQKFRIAKRKKLHPRTVRVRRIDNDS